MNEGPPPCSAAARLVPPPPPRPALAADRDPYRIWVSEVMLQQTTVKAVVPYYESFLERFPTWTRWPARARTTWSRPGRAWATTIARATCTAERPRCAQHAGRFPRTLEAALAVPGVGLYTASAVLSIAYDVALPVVDGNVRRVLARSSRCAGRSGARTGRTTTGRRRCWTQDAPGDWNQAVMELGATVCTPRQPACPACPLRTHCRALELGIVDRLPEARAPSRAGARDGRGSAGRA